GRRLVRRLVERADAVSGDEERGAAGGRLGACRGARMGPPDRVHGTTITVVGTVDGCCWSRTPAAAVSPRPSRSARLRYSGSRSVVTCDGLTMLANPWSAGGTTNGEAMARSERPG